LTLTGGKQSLVAPPAVDERLWDRLYNRQHMNSWQYLNKQLKELSDTASYEVPVFGSTNLNQAELAEGLARDLQILLRHAWMERPSILKELNIPVSLPERYDAILGYYALEQTGNQRDPVLQRARVITELYFDLIYFRDRILSVLHQIILARPEKFGQLEYLSEWLEIVGNNPFAKKIKAMRHGFAHGKWAYLPNYSGLIFFPEPSAPYTRYEVTQEELRLAHGLLYGFQVVFFQIAREELAEETAN